MSESSFATLLQVCITYLEEGFPIPVDTFMELQLAGINVEQVEQLLEEGHSYEEILDLTNP